MTACVFCRIVAGEVAAHIVLDEPPVLAFLDARPLFKGHVLVVPRDHHETLLDLPPALVAPVFSAAARLGGAVEKGLGADGFFLASNNRVSQSVPHLHVHIIPRKKKDGLKGFFWPRSSYGDGEAAELAERIKAALASAARSE